MRSRRVAAVATPVVLAGAAAGLVVALPGTAHAHNVVFVWGDDEDLLSTTAVNQGNVVGMWQSLLDSVSAHITVDGFFGPQTAGATSRFDAELAPPSNGQVEDGDSLSWSAMGNLVLAGDGCDGSFCHYHAGGFGVTPQTRLAMNRSNLNWKWQSDCTSDGRWHDTNHPTIDFAGSC